MKTPSRRIAATVFLWIMAVSAMCMIFVFSAQNSNESTKTSGTVARAVLSLVVPEYKEMTPAQQDALVEKVMLPVRKLAHFSIYAWLGFWLLFLWGQYRKKHLLPLSAAVSAVYAVTDELHQRLACLLAHDRHAFFLLILQRDIFLAGRNRPCHLFRVIF